MNTSKLAETRRQLDSLNVLNERDLLKYHDLLVQLPADERTVYFWFGLSGHAPFALTNICFRMTASTLRALSTACAAPLGLWPDLPFSIQITEPDLPSDACYANRFANAFANWSNLDDQDAICDAASRFGESWGLTLLCPADASSAALARLVPRDWYFSRRRTVQTREILAVLLTVAEDIGWVGYEFANEPRRCVVFFAGRRGDACRRLRLAVSAEGHEAIGIRMSNDGVVLDKRGLLERGEKSPTAQTHRLLRTRSC